MSEAREIDPDAPKTVEELHEYMRTIIDGEGFHYALTEYTDAAYCNAVKLDPELVDMWMEYIQLAARISGHIGRVA